jgi:hypothetical protein
MFGVLQGSYSQSCFDSTAANRQAEVTARNDTRFSAHAAVHPAAERPLNSLDLSLE